MATIRGREKHNERLKRMLSPDALAKIGKAVYVGADKVRVEARRRIAEGAVQGKGHLPAAAGQAPNWDTGHLANNITTRKIGPMQANTASEAEYSDALENGWSTHGPWPFMRPSAQAKRAEIVQDVTKVIQSVIGK